MHKHTFICIIQQSLRMLEFRSNVYYGAQELEDQYTYGIILPTNLFLRIDISSLQRTRGNIQKQITMRLIILAISRAVYFMLANNLQIESSGVWFNISAIKNFGYQTNFSFLFFSSFSFFCLRILLTDPFALSKAIYPSIDP